MEINIGNILVVGGDSQFKLSPPVQGLESPAIRVGDGLYAGRDGGFVSGHFYGHRTIVVNGFYIGTDCENASELRESLLGLLRIRYFMPITITTATHKWHTDGIVSSVKSDFDNLVAGKYQITLLCPDPILYKIEDGYGDPSRIYTSEVASITSGTGEITLDNAGSVEVPMVITWNGQIKGFTIENTTTGKIFSIDDDVPSGNTIISFKNRTIAVDDVNYNSHRSVDSEWFTLIPGENVLELSNSTGGDNQLTISWAIEARAGI